MSVRDPLYWLPDRTPTWSDVVTVVSAVVLLYATRSAEPSGWVWPWVAAGVVLVVITVGPIANTSVGRSFGDWSQNIGVGGRLVVMIVLLIMLFAVERMVAIPSRIGLSVARGGLIAIVVLLSASVLRFREVSGWR